MMRRWLATTLLATLVAVALWLFKYGELPKAYDHDRFRTQPADQLRHFDAFVSSFDGADDDTGDDIPDTVGIPQWVAYELRRHEGPIAAGKRPSRCSTDAELAAADRHLPDLHPHVLGQQCRRTAAPTPLHFTAQADLVDFAGRNRLPVYLSSCMFPSIEWQFPGRIVHGLLGEIGGRPVGSEKDPRVRRVA